MTTNSGETDSALRCLKVQSKDVQGIPGFANSGAEQHRE